MERPTVLCRFGCWFLDGLILAAPMLTTQYLAGMLHFPPRPDTDVSLTLNVVVCAWSGALGIVYFGTMHGAMGKTLGKMAGKIKVVNLDGTPITMSRGYLRAVWQSGPNLLMPLALLADRSNKVPKLLGYVAFAYFLVSVIMALADDDQQRALHDRLAGTRVIALE